MKAVPAESIMDLAGECAGMESRMAIYPVVLAGGSGTRLWPLSRTLHPKQFLAIGGERSLLQQALLRLRGIPQAAAPVIVCNEEHRYLVAEHCRQVGVTPSAIVLEPAGRSTAPALTLGALCAADLARRDLSAGDGDPVLLVAPADHVLRGARAFGDAVSAGVAHANVGGLAAVGVVPTAPNTGYGYVEMGDAVSPTAYRVASFVEKPDEEVARGLVESGRFLWNSGIFLSRASVWIEQIGHHRPDIAEACSRAFELGRQDGEFFRPDAEAFAGCPGDFIAYAILEKIAGRTGDRSAASGSRLSPNGPECVVIPMQAGWSDVGSWSSMWEEEERDAAGNAIRGNVVAESVRDSLLIGGQRLVAAIGLDNVVVVDAEDCVLVADMSRSEEVRAVVERLKSEGRSEV